MDNILKNESKNKNDLSSSSRSKTQSRINRSKLITSNSNQMDTITGFQKWKK